MLKKIWAYWLLSTTITFWLKVISILITRQADLVVLFLIVFPVTLLIAKVIPDPDSWIYFQLELRFH